MNMGGSIRMSAHQLQQLASGVIEGNRVRSRTETDSFVSPVLVCCKAASAVILRL